MNRTTFYKYVRAILIGSAFGLLFIAFESVHTFPGFECGIPSIPNVCDTFARWQHATNDPAYREYLLLQKQGLALRFCLMALDHGFLSIALPAAASVAFVQFKHIRAVDCIRKSLVTAGIFLLFVWTAWMLLSVMQGVSLIDRPFDDMFVYLITTMRSVVELFFCIGIVPLILIISLCVYMVRWTPDSTAQSDG